MLLLQRFIRRVLVFIFAGLLSAGTGFAQRNSSLFDPDPFSDLHLDEAGSLSVLKPGESPVKKIRDNILVQASLTKTKCYVGEPVVLSIRLFTRLESTSTMAAQPALFGFNVHSIPASNEELHYTTLNGKRFRDFIVQQVVLTPFREGRLLVDSLGILNTVHFQNNQGGDSSYAGIVTAPARYLDVLPLPAVPTGSTFNGLIGHFKVVAQQVADSQQRGGTGLLQISLTGNGVIDPEVLPKIEWPAGTQAFPATTIFRKPVTGLPFQDSVVWQVPFTATTPGQYRIPSVTAAFFNPASAAYEMSTAQNIMLSVSESMLNERQYANKHAEPVKERANMVWPGVGLLAALVALLAIVLYARRRKKPAAETPVSSPIVVKIDPGPVALSAIAALEAQAVVPGQFEALKEVLNEFLRSEYNQDPNVILHSMRNATTPVAAKLETWIKTCDYCIYMPAANGKPEWEALAADLKILITELRDFAL